MIYFLDGHYHVETELIKNVSSSTSHKKTPLRLSLREFLPNKFIYESILIK